MASTWLRQISQWETTLETWIIQFWTHLSPLDVGYQYVRRLLIFGAMDVAMFVSLALPENIVQPLIPFPGSRDVPWDALYAFLFGSAGIFTLAIVVASPKLTPILERGWRIAAYGATLVASLGWLSVLAVSAVAVNHDWTRVTSWATLIVLQIWAIQLQADAPLRSDMERIVEVLERYEPTLEDSGSKES